MLKLKEYQVTLISVENEEFEVSKVAENFIVRGYDLLDGIRKADRYLYRHNVIGQVNDFTHDNYNSDETGCEVTFGDASAGLMLRYEVEEI